MQYTIPRKSRRLPLETRVHLKLENRDDPVGATTGNLSLGGMFVETDEQAPSGSLVAFEFHLGDVLVEGTGQVSWCRKADPESGEEAGMGVRFRHLSQGSREKIFRLVQRYAQDGVVALPPPEPGSEDGAEDQSGEESPGVVGPAAIDSLIGGAPATGGAAVQETSSLRPVLRSAEEAEARLSGGQGAPAPASDEEEPAAEADIPPAWEQKGREVLEALGAGALQDISGVTAEPESATEQTVDPVADPGESAPEPTAEAALESEPAEPALGDEWKSWPELQKPTIEERLGDSRESEIQIPVLSQAPPPALGIDAPLFQEERSTEPIPEPAEDELSAASAPQHHGEYVDPMERDLLHRSQSRFPWVPVLVGVGLLAATILMVRPWRWLGPSTAATVEESAPGAMEAPASLDGGESMETQIPPVQEGPAGAEPGDEPASGGDVPRSAITSEPPETPSATAVEAPPETRLAPTVPSGPPLTVVEEITWRQGERATVVAIRGNGPLPSDRYRRLRLEQGSPRILLRLLGVQRPFAPAVQQVGTRELRSIRAGYHQRGSGNELHIVLDLASPDVEVAWVESAEGGLRLSLRQGSGG